MKRSLMYTFAPLGSEVMKVDVAQPAAKMPPRRITATAGCAAIACSLQLNLLLIAPSYLILKSTLGLAE
jgi:hypothetical protein